MSIAHKLLSTFILFLSQHAYALDPGGQLTARETYESSQVSCPAKDFSAFMTAFSNNKIIQKAFTRNPLKKQHLDPDAEPEPKKVIQYLGPHQIQFPIFPLHEERVKRFLEIRIDSVTTTNARITLFKPNTDYQVSYFFKKDTCWRLTQIEDWSL